MSDKTFKILIFAGFLVWFLSAIYSAILNEPAIFLRTFVPVTLYCILVMIWKNL